MIGKRHGKHSNNTTGYKGVMRRNDNGKFVARITVGGKCHHLGSFVTPQEASFAFQDAERRLVPEES